MRLDASQSHFIRAIETALGTLHLPVPAGPFAALCLSPHRQPSQPAALLVPNCRASCVPGSKLPRNCVADPDLLSVLCCWLLTAEAPPGSFPYAAALMSLYPIDIPNDLYQYCGGTLISKYIVMTAGRLLSMGSRAASQRMLGVLASGVDSIAALPQRGLRSPAA